MPSFIAPDAQMQSALQAAEQPRRQQGAGSVRLGMGALAVSWMVTRSLLLSIAIGRSVNPPWTTGANLQFGQSAGASLAA